MRATEFIYEAQRIWEAKQLGRAFNHLEDLVFFHGVSGVQEALEHLHDMATEAGSQSIRMKWDGAPQVYWGREKAGGPLLLAGHNGWLRGAKTDSPEALEDFIANQSGSPKTPAERAQRNAFAAEFASWYDVFDRATPPDFQGYVYADGLYFNQPELDQNGVYNFCPNPKSDTCYHVRADSDLGKRIGQSDIMVVGHAFFPEFGMPDSEQQPISDFSQFNSTDELIVLGPVYNSKPVTVDTSTLEQAEKYAQEHASNIDGFLADMKGLGDLKEIIYRYVNQTAKARQLDKLGSDHFYAWLENSTVSNPKKIRISEKDREHNQATNEIFTLVKIVQAAKNDIIRQLEGSEGKEIWDTNGEGHVRYADSGKKHGNVKLVPRHTWTPG